jgi:cell division protein FtsB
MVRMRAQVAEQAAQIAQLLQRTQELEARLAKDRHGTAQCAPSA